MNKIKVLSLFDGVSCGYLALDRAKIPIESYHAYEIDKYALQVSKTRFPQIQHFGDVRGADFSCHKNIDLLIGGSPCQDLSIAKHNREGLDGKRSGLFWEYVRALKELKPKYFLLENVASMSKEDKAIITEILGAEPILINSALVSGQQRKRLYWTNIPGITQPEDMGIKLADILEDKVEVPIKGCALRTRENPKAKHLEIRKDDKSNALTRVQSDSMICKPIRIGEIGKNGQANRVYSVYGKSVCINSGGGGGGAKTGLYLIGSTQKHAGVCDVKTGKSTTLTSSMGIGGGHVPMLSYTKNVDSVIRKLTPLECERLQTLPDGYTDVGISNTQRYKCIGNAWTVDVIAHILSFIK